MQQLADDLADEVTGYQIEILGINWNVGDPTSNEAMTEGRDLPWLQDVPEENVRLSWAPTYRDVVILDARNEQVGVFNLTSNSLGDAINYETLKELLLTAARFEDDDGDGLGDDWEDLVLGEDSEETGSGDLDSDRSDNFSEFAFGSDGGDPASLPATMPTMLEASGGDLYLSVTFRRRLGTAGGLNYFVEHFDGSTWNRHVAKTLERERVNPYDGTGTVEVTCRLPDPVQVERGSVGLLRVIAEREVVSQGE